MCDEKAPGDYRPISNHGGLHPETRGGPDCQTVRDWLSDHIRPDGSPRPEPALVAHLHTCVACRRAANLMAQISHGMGVVGEQLSPRPELTARILSQIPRRREPALRSYQSFFRTCATAGLTFLFGILPAAQVDTEDTARSTVPAVRGGAMTPPVRGGTTAPSERIIGHGQGSEPLQIWARLQGADGTALPAGATLHNRDELSIAIRVSQASYVYATHVSPSGSRATLFESQNEDDMLSPGRELHLPETRRLILNDSSGIENFLIVVSTRPLEKVARHLCEYLGVSCANGAAAPTVPIDVKSPFNGLAEPHQEENQAEPGGHPSNPEKAGVAVVHLWINHV